MLTVLVWLPAAAVVGAGQNLPGVAANGGCSVLRPASQEPFPGIASCIPHGGSNLPGQHSTLDLHPDPTFSP